MPERIVRERVAGRPLTQRLSALESSQRIMLLRSNPGVLRTVSNTLVSVTLGMEDTQVASLNVVSGRWNCLAEGTISKVATGDEHFNFSIDVLDPASGARLTLPWRNLPYQQWQLGVTGAIWVPFHIFGDFIADTDEVTVVVVVSDSGSGAPFNARNVHLTLIPA